MTQPRQPEGVPTGGQFAATAHAEPGIILTSPVGNIARPAFNNNADRQEYLRAAQQRLEEARNEVQNLYMVDTAEVLKERFPKVATFRLGFEDGVTWINAAWDTDGNFLDAEYVRQANRAALGGEVGSSEDFSTFEDKVIMVEDAAAWRP
jgi:hypothetical protein